MKFGLKFAIVTGIQIACLVGMIGYKYRSIALGTEVVLEVPRPIDPRSLFRGDYVIIRYAINDLDLSEVQSDIGELRYNAPVYVELELQGGVWAPKRVSETRPEGGELFIKGKVINYTSDNMIRMEYNAEQIAAWEKRLAQYNSDKDEGERVEMDLDTIKEFEPGEIYYDLALLEETEPGTAAYLNLEEFEGRLRAIEILADEPDYTDLFIEGKISEVSNYYTVEVEYGIEQYFVPENTGLDMEDHLREVQKAIVSIDPSGNATVVGIPEE